MNYTRKRFPKSRIATFDVFAIGKKKNHVSAFLEFDVTEGRKKIHQLRKEGLNISFTGWIVSEIANTLNVYPEIASFRKNKTELIVYEGINIAMLAEKKTGSEKVPLPFIIENAGKKSVVEITTEIREAVSSDLTEKDIVIHKKPKFAERLYYFFPACIRRLFWRFLLNSPVKAFKTMGNVSVTSLSMAGKINGWFMHSSVHPVSFGIGAVIKKPVVVDDSVQIREILNMTVLLDHDVADGVPMAKFIKHLSGNISKKNCLKIYFEGS
jgi:pyruvate/2-oxoglutarate dehydrogenase complex dihydrolipoamide acyltransferase (E2) component